MVKAGTMLSMGDQSCFRNRNRHQVGKVPRCLMHVEGTKQSLYLNHMAVELGFVDGL